MTSGYRVQIAYNKVIWIDNYRLRVISLSAAGGAAVVGVVVLAVVGLRVVVVVGGSKPLISKGPRNSGRNNLRKDW